MAHALATAPFGFGVARAFLGIFEAGNFPAAIKTIAEWFPKKERALATGIFNSGASIGAIFAPLLVPLIAKEWGWKWAFILTGLIGLVWLVFWFIFYEIPEKQKRLSEEEFKYILSDNEKEDNTSVPWLRLLRYRQTWAFFTGKFLTDPIWWFYLFWIPGWLAKVQGLIDDAPPLLQQSMLASKTQKQFAANLALLQQLQKGTLEEGIVAAKSLAKSGKLAAVKSAPVMIRVEDLC